MASKSSVHSGFGQRSVLSSTSQFFHIWPQWISLPMTLRQVCLKQQIDCSGRDVKSTPHQQSKCGNPFKAPQPSSAQGEIFRPTPLRQVLLRCQPVSEPSSLPLLPWIQLPASRGHFHSLSWLFFLIPSKTASEILFSKS